MFCFHLYSTHIPRTSFIYIYQRENFWISRHENLLSALLNLEFIKIIHIIFVSENVEKMLIKTVAKMLTTQPISPNLANQVFNIFKKFDSMKRYGGEQNLI